MENKTSVSKTGIQLVLEFLDRVWHPPHDLNAIDELMTEDYKIVTGGREIHGRTAFKEWVNNFQLLLLNASTDSKDIFMDLSGSKVVSRWVCSGYNNGIFGLKANGQFLSFTGIAIWEVRHNRLAACWVERSAWELYQTLLSETSEQK